MTPAFDTLRHVSGITGVLQQQNALDDLADRTGQTGAMALLDFYLHAPDFGNKLPHLFLLYGADGQMLVAAVLLFEYRVGTMRTGVFISPDPEGERTVIAPAAWRAEIAWRTATKLLHGGGGRLLLLVVDGVDFEPLAAADADLSVKATMRKTARHNLKVRATIDETLSQFGARTRRNIRAARRKALSQPGLTFVPSATLTEQEFLVFSRETAYPVQHEIGRWRFRYATDRGFLAGLRDRSGAWVALMGGRRQFPTLVLDWQMNRSDLAGLSVGLVMRGLLMEEALRGGYTLLRFEGGTSHPMRNGFVPQTAGYALLGTGWMRSAMVRSLIRRLVPAKSLLNTWVDWDELIWHNEQS